MDKFNLMQPDTNAAGNRPWGGYQSPIQDGNNPRPGIAEPHTPKPDEDPDKKEEEPSKKKKKKNIYEITC